MFLLISTHNLWQAAEKLTFRDAPKFLRKFNFILNIFFAILLTTDFQRYRAYYNLIFMLDLTLTCVYRIKL